MSNVSSSNGLGKYPKLRFKGFSEPWKTIRIGEIYAERSERGAEDMKLLSVTMNDGVKMRSDIEGKDNSSEDKSNYKIVRAGDMVYNSMRMWQGANGISPWDGIVSPAYTVLKPRMPISNGFFAALFKTYRLINEFRKNSQGMTSDTWNLKYPQIETIKTSIPTLSEQERIAEFLTSLDKRIEKQRTLVEALKKYKRGVLKAILEQKWRFRQSDGTDYSKWESYTLSEITECLDSRRIPITANERTKGEYPYYGANGVQDFVADYIFDGEFVLLAEDGGHFNDFATEPLAQYVSGKIWVNNHAHILKAKCNTRFLFYSLVHKDIRNYINNPSRGKLNQEDMQNIIIDLPCIEEQDRIVGAMLTLDRNIESKTSILNRLLDLKKGLLQQLFI